jgi:hypothetical protein
MKVGLEIHREGRATLPAGGLPAVVSGAAGMANHAGTEVDSVVTFREAQVLGVRNRGY